MSVVRERATWQARALADGSITAITVNQGILGDPYYYLVDPEHKILLGFTTGPSASVRSVGIAILHQFKKDRTSKIVLEPIAKEHEYAMLKGIIEFTEVRFSVNPSLLSKTDDELPDIFKGLKSSPFMVSSSKLELTVSDFGEEAFTHENLLDVVDYLTENEFCTTLIVKGIDGDGNKQQLNLNNAYLNYNTFIQLRTKFVDEQTAMDIIFKALTAKEHL